MNYLYNGLIAIFLFLMVEKSKAQDLDPRAYARVPVNMTFLVTGFGYSHGGVLTEPTLPVTDLHAAVESLSFGCGYTFRLFGQTAQVSAALPYAWAQLTGNVGGAAQSTTRSGLSDMRLRFSMLLVGAPASTRAGLAKAERHTIIGTSLTIVAPTGQYFPEKLINLGTSRWSVKPEIALSQPLGRRWLIDFYSGLWLFTKNDSFYPGNSDRTQNPMGSFQGHISYNIQTRMWAAFDMTYYTGGTSSVNGTESNDRQSNSRIGGTIVLPIGKVHSVKIAFSTGAIIRAGADFTTISVGWQTSFFSKPESKSKE
jgi:hypothetical protein